MAAMLGGIRFAGEAAVVTEKDERLTLKGRLVAESKAELDAMADGMDEFLERRRCRLRLSDGRVYRNLRMDSLRLGNRRAAGGVFSREYTIMFVRMTAGRRRTWSGDGYSGRN